MKVLYIAGPYRAQTEWELERNIRHAEEVALIGWQLGYAVFCPHKNTAHFGGSCSDDVWLDGTMEFLRRSDAVCMLSTWQASVGARAELEEARRLGLDIIAEGELRSQAGRVTE